MRTKPLSMRVRVCVYIYTRADDTKRVVVCVGMCGGNRDLERKKANFEWCLSHEIQVFRVLKFRVFGAERERERERERPSSSSSKKKKKKKAFEGV